MGGILRKITVHELAAVGKIWNLSEPDLPAVRISFLFGIQKTIMACRAANDYFSKTTLSMSLVYEKACAALYPLPP
jgi:hypothetical protein